MNKFVEAEILATCNALGIVIRGQYEKGRDCLDCLKDLLRYLRKDDDNHSVLRFLGRSNLLENDLIPLVKRYEDHPDIFDFSLRLLVALTSPALLYFQEEVPEDKVSNNVYLEMMSYLNNYKRAFCDTEVWAPLQKHLARLMEMRPVERTEEENLLLERMLILIRNVLHIPHEEGYYKTTDDTMSLQDRVVWTLHKAKIDIVVLYMCSCDAEYSYCLHMLEVVSLILREHSAEVLASTSEQRTDKEKQEDLDLLRAERQKEINLKARKVQSAASARFNGVYRVQNLKSLGSNDYIAHKFISNLNEVRFDENKAGKRIPKNRVPLKDASTTRRSTLEIRCYLKRFCYMFLKCYNKLMSGVKRELGRKASAEHDDSYYLWALEYFMKFNRLTEFEIKYTSSTVSVNMFHHVQTQITNYMDMMHVDKKKSGLWSRRARLGVSAYKELLHTVFALSKSKDPALWKNADDIVSKVVYVVEYRELTLSLLTNFDEVKFSLTYLSELVESSYMFLKMMENHAKRYSEITIQKKKKKVKRRKKKPAAQQQPGLESVDLEAEWSVLANQLSAAVQGRRDVPTDSSPFDGASEVPFEEQKVDAMYKIRNALTSKQAEQAVSLLRSARELWPDGDSFGAADIDSEDEFMALREIYLSDIRNPRPEEEVPVVEEESETDEEEESVPSVQEQKLCMDDMYRRYATHKVVQPCCLLLANYQNNSAQTNASLVKLMHKVAWDCKMHALFFQSTVFLTFRKIFDDPDATTNPVTRELYRFARYVVSRFFQAAEKNDKVFVELLFWKGAREAYELEEGYDTAHSTIKGAWTEREESELIDLYQENKDVHIEGQDVADIILASITNKNRTKHQVTLALKRLGFIKHSSELKPHLRKEWTEDEVSELRNLFEDLRGSEDVMGGILSKLSIRRSRKRVVEKMLELGLIQDKKEVLKKKQGRKSAKQGGSSEESSSSGDEGNEEAGTWEGASCKPGEDSSENEEEEENFFERLRAQRAAEGLNSVSQVDSKEVYDDLTDGLERISEPKKNKQTKNSDVWQEQEIVELTTIFHSNRGSPDIMADIMRSLTTKRTKQSITEKLLEVGLIRDKKEIRKKRSAKSVKKVSLDASGFVVSGGENPDSDNDATPSGTNKKNKRSRLILSDSEEDDLSNSKQVDLNESAKSKTILPTPKDSQKSRKRPPKVWDEVEIIQLTELFKKFKESNDVMGDIMSELTVKRPKESLIEKLLEVGLIEDRKEVRKKRQNKKDKLKENKIENSPVSLTQKQKKRIQNSILSDSSEDETVPLVSTIHKENGSDSIGENILNQSGNRTKVKNLILSDSSEDETVPLDRIQKKKDGSKRLKLNSSLLSEDSDDDIPLNNFQNKSIFTEKQTVPSAKTPQENSDSALSSDDSDDDIPLNIIKKKNAVNSSEKQNKPSENKDKMNMKPKRKASSLLSDSDGDSVEKNKDISSGKETSLKKEFQSKNAVSAPNSSKYSIKKTYQVLYESSEDESQDGGRRTRKKIVTGILSETSDIDPLGLPEPAGDGSENAELRNGMSKKRKRLVLDESEDSEKENGEAEPEVPSQLEKIENGGTFKKRARVIVDSDSE